MPLSKRAFSTQILQIDEKIHQQILFKANSSRVAERVKRCTYKSAKRDIGVSTCSQYGKKWEFQLYTPEF